MNALVLHANKLRMALAIVATMLLALVFTSSAQAVGVCQGNICVADDTATIEECKEDADCVADGTAPSGPSDSFGLNKVDQGLGGTLGNQPLITSVTRIINVALGLLGLVAVIIVLVGGFKWMTAGGNEEKVGEARKLIFAGIIGLAIILAAWAIAQFVIVQLVNATGGDTKGLEQFQDQL